MEPKQHKLKFHRISWNFVQFQTFMEFQGTFFMSPMEFDGTVIFSPESSMEFHRIPRNFFEVPCISNNCCWHLIDNNVLFGQFSQKYCNWLWFQFHFPYFGHASFSENGKRPAKMGKSCNWDAIFFSAYNKHHWDIFVIIAYNTWRFLLSPSTEFIYCIVYSFNECSKRRPIWHLNFL